MLLLDSMRLLYPYRLVGMTSASTSFAFLLCRSLPLGFGLPSVVHEGLVFALRKLVVRIGFVLTEIATCLVVLVLCDEAMEGLLNAIFAYEIEESLPLGG